MSYTNNLTQLTNEPTRYLNYGAYLLDLICVERNNYVKYSEVQPLLLNLDHCTVYCKLKFKVSKPHAFKRQVWDYKSADFNGLNTAFSNAPFETAYTIFDDVGDIVNYTKWPYII